MKRETTVLTTPKEESGANKFVTVKLKANFSSA